MTSDMTATATSTEPQPLDQTSGPGGVERRSPQASPRVKASLVPSITGILVGIGGPRMSLVNISSSGVLIEGPARLKPGNEVKLVFEGGFSPSIVPSRVVRTAVTGIGREGSLHYQAGLAFLTSVVVPVPEDLGCPAEPQPQPVAPLDMSAISIEESAIATEDSAIATEEALVGLDVVAAVFEQVCAQPDPQPAVPRNRW